MSSQRKLIDYTQRGKPFNREYNSHFEQSCCSASCSSEPVTSSCWQRRESLSAASSSDNSSTTQKSSLEFIDPANDTPGLDESIDFMLKIPTDRLRPRRSDLRERFTTRRRSFKRSNLIESTLSEATYRRRSQRLRASF